MSKYRDQGASEGTGKSISFCDQTIDELVQYRRNSVPLMPHQIVYLRKNGFDIGQEAMRGRIAKNMEMIELTPITGGRHLAYGGASHD